MTKGVEVSGSIGCKCAKDLPEWVISTQSPPSIYLDTAVKELGRSWTDAHFMVKQIYITHGTASKISFLGGAEIRSSRLVSLWTF